MSGEEVTGASVVDYSFDILAEVAQGSYTKWSIVYDIANKQIHFKTEENRNRREVAFTDFDFSCGDPSLAFPLSEGKAGSVASLFAPLTYNKNKLLIQKSATESKNHVAISAAEIEGAAKYFSMPKCY
jgi:choloylglycine hydrolase